MSRPAQVVKRCGFLRACESVPTRSQQVLITIAVQALHSSTLASDIRDDAIFRFNHCRGLEPLNNMLGMECVLLACLLPTQDSGGPSAVAGVINMVVGALLVVLALRQVARAAREKQSG
jgi:hypothetical protein